MEFDGRREMEDSGPPCRFQKLMPGPWRTWSDRRYEDWRWRHQDREFATGDGPAQWREGAAPLTIELDDVMREHLRQMDAIVRKNGGLFVSTPRLVRR